MKKKSTRKKIKYVDMQVYSIFDTTKNIITKISLDHAEIDMEIALMGGLKDNLQECEFDIRVII